IVAVVSAFKPFKTTENRSEALARSLRLKPHGTIAARNSHVSRYCRSPGRYRRRQDRVPEAPPGRVFRLVDDGGRVYRPRHHSNFLRRRRYRPGLSRPDHGRVVRYCVDVVIFAGSDLFTGVTMFTTHGVLRRKIGIGDLGAAWTLCWLGNLAGAVVVVALF